MQKFVRLSDRTFGCEFEFDSDREKTSPFVIRAIENVYGKRSVVDTPNYTINRSNYKRWFVKEDSSVAFEVTTPISKWKDMKKIQKVVELWKVSGKLRVTQYTGFHVHVAKVGVTKKQLMIAWLLVEPFISQCFPRYRSYNTYSHRFVKKNKVDLNLNNYSLQDFIYTSEHHTNAICTTPEKTYEFRICEGHFDPVITRNWVKFCLLFMNFAQKIKVDEYVNKKVSLYNSIISVLNNMSIKDQEVIRFIKKRHRQHKIV